jgi:uncharacterized protein
MLTIVLDTNILLVSLPPMSPYAPIFECFSEGKYRLAFSNEMLTEYEEKITERYDKITANLILDLFSAQHNTLKINRYYRWNLINIDPDDNPFVDCFVAANADYLVTNDKHFNILKQIPFPKVTLTNAEDFLEICKNL